jgi:hypothetical protein
MNTFFGCHRSRLVSIKRVAHRHISKTQKETDIERKTMVEWCEEIIKCQTVQYITAASRDVLCAITNMNKCWKD